MNLYLIHFSNVVLGNNRIRIYSLHTGNPLHIIGMKGTDNGQFLQPITVCFLQMPFGGVGNVTKTNDPPKDDNAKTVPVLAAGDSNNRLQVRKSNLLKPVNVKSNYAAITF